MGELFAGRYELLDPVASGGMGVVWRVLDHTDGQVKAAKILRQSDAASLLRFVREQGLRIDHPHVVTPTSWAGVDDRVLFTMRLVRGGSVHDLVKSAGPLPPRWVATLLDQTLQALEVVHGAGVVHRDVKPANLLLEPTGRGRPHLRLTDFGIAVPLDQPRITHASQVIGTPGYMSPEHQSGADPDPRQDLYSAATVAAEMLTAQRAPAGHGGIDLRGVTETYPEAAPLVGLIEWATRPDPSQRPSTATQMREQLAASGLAALPARADELIDIVDRFADLPTPGPPVTRHQVDPADVPTEVSGSSSGSGGSAPGTAYLVAEPTRMEVRSAPGPPVERRSAVPGLLLILIGLVALAGAGWLYFS